MNNTETTGSYLKEDWHGGYSLHSAKVEILPITRTYLAVCSDCDWRCSQSWNVPEFAWEDASDHVISTRKVWGSE